MSSHTKDVQWYNDNKKFFTTDHHHWIQSKKNVPFDALLLSLYLEVVPKWRHVLEVKGKLFLRQPCMSIKIKGIKWIIIYVTSFMNLYLNDIWIIWNQAVNSFKLSLKRFQIRQIVKCYEAEVNSSINSETSQRIITNNSPKNKKELP